MRRDTVKQMNTFSVELDTLLAKALKFSADDLIANREGYMTKEQRKRLRRIGLSHYLPTAIGSVIFGAAFLLCLLIFLTGLRDNQLTLLLAFFGFGSVWLAGYAYVQRRKLKADLEKGHVIAAEGRIRLNIYGLSGHIGYSIGIENQSFKIRRGILLAFKNGEPYRIYFTPHTRTLLSAEPIL